MKVLIISGAALRLTPYAQLYIDAAKKNGHTITILVWERNNEPDNVVDSSIKVIRFKNVLDDSESKINKIVPFLLFRKFLRKNIQRNNPDFIVSLDTQFAVLINSLIRKKYKNKYIYDMRDMSFEHISLYRKIVAKIVNASKYTFISSEDYRRFLPSSTKIFTFHNYQKSELQYIGLRNKNVRNQKKIRISFWGMIREVELNLFFISCIKNDERFLVNYYGSATSESKRLNEYCEAQNVRNVVFWGPYSNDKKHSFVSNTDLILNLHYNKRKQFGSPEMGNKFYDGIIYEIPQICSKNTFMGNYAEKYQVGVCIELNENIGDCLWNYYNSIEWNKFSANCCSIRECIIDQQEKSLKLLDNIFSNE